MITAIGAPAGAALYAAYGFAAIAVATAAAPLLALWLVAPLPTVAPGRTRSSFASVIGTVWVPGLGSALGSVGFGAVTTFVALLFASRGWANGWLAYTAYAWRGYSSVMWLILSAAQKSRWSAR
jgi:hypothetical protein